MLIGDRNDFAIQFDVVQVVDGWALGQFFFWLGGVSLGDQSDMSVDIKGCMRWLRLFAQDDGLRLAEAEISSDKVLAYAQLCTPLSGHISTDVGPELNNAFSRFHLSHLGMSSFDRVTLLLVETPSSQRCIWQEGDGPISEKFLQPGTLQSVAAQAVAEWDRLTDGQ